MLPSFYQACLQSQLSATQFATLEILVELLQKEQRITIERLATLFPQPILFESRWRNMSAIFELAPVDPASPVVSYHQAVDQTTPETRENASGRDRPHAMARP